MEYRTLHNTYESWALKKEKRYKIKAQETYSKSNSRKLPKS
jgi:hypothetical protein